MTTATVTSKGQITIPKDIREKLNLHAGDKINFLSDDDGKVTISPTTGDISSLKGIVPKPKKPVTLKEMNETVKVRARSIARN